MAIPQVMEYTLIVSGIALAGLLFRRLLYLELTLASLLAGVVSALVIGYFGLDTGIRASNVKDLVFYVILPLLIFVASWHLDLEQFKRWFRLCFLLASAGVILSAGITALGLYWLMGDSSGFPWIAAILVGIMLAATDPVSVSSQLKRAGAPKSLQTLFEGESLLNDAAAIVLFGVALTYALGQQPEQSAGMMFLSVLAGGLMVGIFSGSIAAGLIRLLNNRAASVIVLVITAFASFFIAERLLHVSGILSVMMAALSSRYILKNRQDELLDTVKPTWEWIGLFLNAMIFSLLGLLITWEMFTHRWLAMLFAIGASLAGRFIAVYLIALFTHKSRYRLDWYWSGLLSWGGLKGAIAVVLVLSLPIELAYWWTVQSIVFGVVLFSLLVQGTTFPLLLKKSALSNSIAQENAKKPTREKNLKKKPVQDSSSDDDPTLYS